MATGREALAVAPPKGDSSDPLASVRWYWKDWRASTARAVLSPIERYAYRELLDAHYASDDCTIPDDPRLLAGLVDLPLRAWNRIAGAVLQHIPVTSPGKRQHPRCLVEWKKAISAREAAIEAGRRGGLNRAKRARQAQGSLEGGLRVAQASLKPSASAASSEGSSQKADAPVAPTAPVAPPVRKSAIVAPLMTFPPPRAMP